MHNNGRGGTKPAINASLPISAVALPVVAVASCHAGEGASGAGDRCGRGGPVPNRGDRRGSGRGDGIKGDGFYASLFASCDFFLFSFQRTTATPHLFFT
uniref:Lipoprotein n=1 Tax=Oryza nivara TaxID=4536 RepID=A0A0E0J1H8_ORYNI